MIPADELHFYAPTATARRGHTAFSLSVCTSVRLSIDQVKIFVQGRISRPINGSKLIFHMRVYLYETSRNIQEPWPHDLYFTVHWLRTLARWSRLRFLSKVESQDLLMVADWYFIWWCISLRPAGIYKSHDLLTYISWSFGFGLGQIESQDLLMVASWYFIWGCISMRPAGIYKSHDLLTYISRSADFRLWPIFHG